MILTTITLHNLFLESEAKEEKFTLSLCTTIFKDVFRTMWDIKWTGVTAFLVFALTLMVFPALVVRLKPEVDDPHSIWKSEHKYLQIYYTF